VVGCAGMARRQQKEGHMSRTHSSCEGPICPYCGSENSSAGNDYWAEQAGSGEHDCDNCGMPFHFEVDFATHYYASKINVDGKS
jgi:transcription elongation factor Elf1